MQAYLETVIAREDHAKEVKLYRAGPAAARPLQGHLTTSCSPRTARSPSAATAGVSRWGCWRPLALYCGYCWVAVSAVRGVITIGEMTMYLMLFRQGQTRRELLRWARSAACTRTTSTFRRCTNIWTRRRGPRGRHRESRSAIPATACGWRTCRFTYPGADRACAVGCLAAPEARRQSRAGGREWIRQDHADQAAHAPVRADLRPHPAGRTRPRRLGRRWRCARASA